MSEENYSLQCRGVCKSFGANTVLSDINLDIKRGEVHALLGQNGAGKSTLVKIITGVYPRDAGALFIDEKPAVIENPLDAKKAGIAIIHQDQQMVAQFDVTRNAFLGSELVTPLGALDFTKMRALVNEQLLKIKAPFNANAQVSSLSVGEREQAAIAAALLQHPKILILDEPTASLSSHEVALLFEVIATLKSHGVTVIYISHHLDEVFKICDSITVLREARVQGTFAVKDVSHEEVVTMMIGRKLEEFYPKKDLERGGALLDVKKLHSGQAVRGVDFTLYSGEILGFAGLIGAGRTETMLALYTGAGKISGDITLQGERFVPRSPADSRKKGFAFIPEDRRNEGIVSMLSIAQNLSLAFTSLLTKNSSLKGIINKKLERETSEAAISNLNIVCTGQEQPVGELSGGNQQKVVIGRWLSGSAKVFVFDQPTTGVDVGAKTEIYKQMGRLAAQGCGVIFISSENEELLGMCDRILVMVKGRVVQELSRAEATEEKLLFWTSGGGV